MTLRLLDTFSGIGGFSYAAEQIVGGYETVAFVEREPFCQKILNKHWPNVPIHDDIATFKPEAYSADVVCGGFPCQDISTAGKQAGIKQGTRSGLFYELIRVIRLVQPKYVVLENVSAILANGLDTVLGELAEAGFDAEWACIPASAVGACHQRDRWWLVAYAKSNARQFQSSQRQDLRNVAAVNGEEGSVAVHSDHCHGESGPLARSAVHEQAACQGANGDAGSTDEVSTDASNTSSERLERPQHQEWSAAEQLCPNWGGYISEPVLCRGDDGLSNRVERLKALGNAVVPQVAAIPLARVRELANV